MASHPRSPAASEERRLNVRRLAIASIASASAAVIVSQFSVAGTWMAAAITPVIVILLQEALHKPTEVVADRLTARRTEVLREGPEVLPEGAGAGPPRMRAQEAPGERGPVTRAPAEPGSERGDAARPPVRVYRSGAGGGPVRPRSRRRRLALGTAALTAVLAFAIAAFAITGTELVTGGSIGAGDRDTTLFGGGSGDTDTDTETAPAEREQPQDQPGQPAAPPGGAERQDGEGERPRAQPEQPEGGQTTPSTPAPPTQTAP